MKVKTADLIGPALDWAVAIITNPEWTDEDRWYNTIGYVDCGNPDDEPYSPSTDWRQGGPIVDREGIYFGPLPDKGIRAYRFIDGEYYNIMDCWGASITRCVVAMRCFVASQLGDEVDIPEELLT